MRALLTLLALTLAAPAAAQPVLISTAPDRVAVTVYRDPERGETAMNLEWLNGFALISERRRIRLPAGESVVRFEGVAGGIVPQSAIVTGFPGGIVERNRDAYLLSPGTLLDRSLGRRVHLRRTLVATGAVSEQDAVIRSGAGGAVVLETAGGIESLRCTGLPETLVYDEVPPGLSSKPTLSVRTRASAEVEAEVTLSYLATGFDWQANYIAELNDDDETMTLFAWLTLGSTDETSFPNADTQAVAGRLNYTDAEVPEAEGGALTLTCWPAATTSDIPLEEWERMTPRQLGALRMSGGESEMIVTAQRRQELSMDMPLAVASISAETLQATQESLGDLKLYRIPEPVTVAANSQKQVALLIRPNVPVQLVYRGRIDAGDTSGELFTERVLVTRNREDEELGIPLPSGRVAAFVTHAGAPFLLGQGSLADRAVGEDVEIEIGESPGVQFRVEQVAKNDAERWAEYRLIVTSDRSRPVRFEAELPVPDGARIVRPNLPERDGMRLWAVTVPANGTMVLRYRLQLPRR